MKRRMVKRWLGGLMAAVLLAGCGQIAQEPASEEIGRAHV